MGKIIVTGASQGLGYDLADYLSGNGNKVVGISRTKSDLDIQHISTDFSDKGSILQTIFNILDIHNDASTIIICAAIGAKIGYKANKFIPVYSMTKWGLRGMIENWRDFLKGTQSRVIGVHPEGLDTESNIGKEGRKTIISKLTGKSIPTLIKARTISELVGTFLNLPKNIEISEIIINRK